MTRYVCTLAEGLCDRHTTCGLRQQPPTGTVHIIYIKPETPGGRCPHYFRDTSKGETACS